MISWVELAIESLTGKEVKPSSGCCGRVECTECNRLATPSLVQETFFVTQHLIGDFRDFSTFGFIKNKLNGKVGFVSGKPDMVSFRESMISSAMALTGGDCPDYATIIKYVDCCWVTFAIFDKQKYISGGDHPKSKVRRLKYQTRYTKSDLDKDIAIRGGRGDMLASVFLNFESCDTDFPLRQFHIPLIPLSKENFDFLVSNHKHLLGTSINADHTYLCPYTPHLHELERFYLNPEDDFYRPVFVRNEVVFNE